MISAYELYLKTKNCYIKANGVICGLYAVYYSLVVPTSLYLYATAYSIGEFQESIDQGRVRYVHNSRNETELLAITVAAQAVGAYFGVHKKMYNVGAAISEYLTSTAIEIHEIASLHMYRIATGHSIPTFDSEPETLNGTSEAIKNEKLRCVVS